MKKWALTLVVLVTLKVVLWRLNDRFSIDAIYTALPRSEQWEPEIDLDEETFTYLGKGSQFYVFASSDGKNVLKLFRHDRTEVPAWAKGLPLPAFEETIHKARIARKEANRAKLFASCRLAYEELREECGLLALHLEETPHWSRKIWLKDRLGRIYPVDLGGVSFVIQKRGERIQPVIERYIESGMPERAREALASIHKVLQMRIAKGITDHDPYLTKNAGVCEGVGLLMDIGQFERVASIDPSEIDVIWRRLNAWLAKEGFEGHTLLMETKNSP